MPRVYNLTPYFDASSDQTRLNHRNRLNEILINFKECAAQMGLQIDSMTLTRKTSENSFKLKPSCFVEKQNSSAKKLSKLKYKVQKARDYCNLSERKYSLFKKLVELNKVLPSINQCSLIKNQINSYFDLEENDMGFYLLNPGHKIALSILDYYKRNNNEILENKIRIKIACDSTNLSSKSMKHLNLTFCLVNDKINAMSVKGNFILGMFKIEKEDYETLKLCLKNIFEKLKHIKSIKINNQMYEIEHFNGGDMKSYNLLFGLNGPNSKQPCVTCLWDKTQILDLDEVNRFDKRTLIMANTNIGTNGFKNEPITYIEYDHCPPEMLHLFIR